MECWLTALSSALCLEPIPSWWVLMRTKQLSMAAPGGTGGVEEVIWLYACVTWSAHTPLFGAVCFLPDISTKTFLIARMARYNLTTKEGPIWLKCYLQSGYLSIYRLKGECINMNHLCNAFFYEFRRNPSWTVSRGLRIFVKHFGIHACCSFKLAPLILIVKL